MSSLPFEAGPSEVPTMPEVSEVKGDNEASGVRPQETVYAASSYRMLSEEQKNSYTRIHFTRPTKAPAYVPTERTSSSSFKAPVTKKIKEIEQPPTQGTLSSALDYITSPVWYITSVFSKRENETEGQLKSTVKDASSSIQTSPIQTQSMDAKKSKNERISLADAPKASKANPPKIGTSPARNTSVANAKPPTIRSVSPSSMPASNVKIAPSNSTSYRVTSKERPEPPPKLKKDPRKLFQRSVKPGSPVLASSSQNLNKERAAKIVDEKPNLVTFPTVLPRPHPESYVMKSELTVSDNPDKSNSAASDIANLSLPSSKPQILSYAQIRNITKDMPVTSSVAYVEPKNNRFETIGPTFTVPTQLPTPKKYVPPTTKNVATLGSRSASTFLPPKKSQMKTATTKKRSPSEPLSKTKQVTGARRTPLPPKVYSPTMLPSMPTQPSLPLEPEIPPELSSTKSEVPLPPTVLSPFVENALTKTSPMIKQSPEPPKIDNPTEQLPKQKTPPVSQTESVPTSPIPLKTNASVKSLKSPQMSPPKLTKSPSGSKLCLSNESSPGQGKTSPIPKKDSPVLLSHRPQSSYTLEMGSPGESFHAKVKSPKVQEFPTFLGPTVLKSPSPQKVSGTGRKFSTMQKNSFSPASKKKKSKNTSPNRKRRSAQANSPPPAKKWPKYTVPTKKPSPEPTSLQSNSSPPSVKKVYHFKDYSATVQKGYSYKEASPQKKMSNTKVNTGSYKKEASPQKKTSNTKLYSGPYNRESSPQKKTSNTKVNTGVYNREASPQKKTSNTKVNTGVYNREASPQKKTSNTKVNTGAAPLAATAPSAAAAAAAAATTTAAQMTAPAQGANPTQEEKTTQDTSTPQVNNISQDASTNQVTETHQNIAATQGTPSGDTAAPTTQDTAIAQEPEKNHANIVNMKTPPATPPRKRQSGTELVKNASGDISSQDSSYWIREADSQPVEKINWSAMHSPKATKSTSPTSKRPPKGSPLRVDKKHKSPAKIPTLQKSKKSKLTSSSPQTFKSPKILSASPPCTESYGSPHVEMEVNSNSADDDFPDSMDGFGGNPAYHASASTLLGEFP